MKWEILILTMSTRKDFLNRLLVFLGPQIVPGVKITIRTCDPKHTLGENREMMRRAATAEYINFIDDDDLVAPDYVDRILPLLDGVDQVGFECEVWSDNVKDQKRDFHVLKAGGWHENEWAFWRDISHLQPMRRELALAEPMEGGHGEDSRWADKMRGKVKTEHYIDKILYFYFFRSNKNRAKICPKCKSESTVRVEHGNWCNACGTLFEEHAEQK